VRAPLFAVAAPLICLPGLLLAQVPTSPGPVASPDVVGRLNQLEAETQALRAEVQWLREHPAVRLPAVEAQPGTVAATPVAMESSEMGIASPDPAQPQYATMAQVTQEVKKFAWKKGDFTITPYGYLWGNTVFSTERTTPGSYTLYVQSPNPPASAESEWITDVRNTRLGFDVIGPQIPLFNCAQSGGKVEIDFQNDLLAKTNGAISTENKPTIMLRHAYLEVKDDEFRFLVGQTWDVVSPLLPGMLMYSVGWDGGNIGYRRAQVRYERYMAFSDTSLATAQLSINQTVFSDGTSATPILKGEPPDWPIVEGRAAWTIGERGKDCYPITIGVSGHIGATQCDVTGDGQDINRSTWSGNIDARWPLGPCFGVQGECFVGQNLAPFLGGIGQGIDPVTRNPIRDMGGWCEVWYDWTPCLHSHVGYSIDDPNDNDLSTVGERSYNQFYFGNLIYDLTKNFLIGLEVSSWRTLYVGQLPGDSVRSEFVVKYGF
jgi:hypothetical protein